MLRGRGSRVVTFEQMISVAFLDKLATFEQMIFVAIHTHTHTLLYEIYGWIAPLNSQITGRACQLDIFNQLYIYMWVGKCK
jgi:hypothetical protein